MDLIMKNYPADSKARVIDSFQVFQLINWQVKRSEFENFDFPREFSVMGQLPVGMGYDTLFFENIDLFGRFSTFTI